MHFIRTINTSPERKLRPIQFQSCWQPEAALEEIPDELDDEVDGLFHLHGEGVAVELGNDEEKDLVEVKEEREVVSINHSALQLSYINEAVTIDLSWDVKKNILRGNTRGNQNPRG